MKRKPKIYDYDGKRLLIKDFVIDSEFGLAQIESQDPNTSRGLIVLKIKQRNGLYRRYGFTKTIVNNRSGYHIGFFRKYEKKTTDL